MSSSMVQSTESPTQSERQLSALMHIGGIFFPYLAPIVCLVINRGKSRFVSMHAVQALVEAIVLSAAIIIVTIISLAFTAVTVWKLVQTQGQSFDWGMVWGAVIKSLLLWAGFALVSLWYTVQSVADAMQALKGEWKPSVISGRITRRLLKEPGLVQRLP